MEYRQFGRTGLAVSALGFGCGAVGGLLIKGDRKEMVRVVARAVELGITYVVQAFQKLQHQGKIRSWGINGLGETEALLQAVSSVPAASIQYCFNLLNPSAGVPAPDSFPYQDYRQLIDTAAGNQIGVIALRVYRTYLMTGP